MFPGSLSGRTALITGASSGIGEATATLLGKLGARLVLAARRRDRLEALTRRLAGEGVACRALPFDVTDPASVRGALAELGEEPLDLLVNNAGLARGLARVEDCAESDWQEMLEANVMGLMRVTRELLPRLRARPLADLVMVSSVAGLQPYALGAAYCASKAAVEAFSSALRLELSGSNVRVLVLAPGMVQTEFSEVRFHGDAERAQAVYRGMRPLSAEDVAECIAFAVTRRPHVSLHHLLVMPTDQAAATVVHRR